MQAFPVPRFYLYGEPHQTAAADFVHVEEIDDRSRPSDWTIKPHAHAERVQLFVILSGGGTLVVDGEPLPFAAPCILSIPVAVVHGFSWVAESRGYVVTLAASFAGQIARVDPAIDTIFAKAGVASLGGPEADRAEAAVRHLMQELGWAKPAHRAAVSGYLIALGVLVLRSSAHTGSAEVASSRALAVVARYRERVEQRFRLREPLDVHARNLGVSTTALRTACSTIAGKAPMAMIDDRALLEAKRQLLYTCLSVGEVGYSVGFDDAAYFSRFFSRHVGQSPKEYRAGAG